VTFQLFELLIDCVLSLLEGIFIDWSITPQLRECGSKICIKFIDCPINPLINKGFLEFSGAEVYGKYYPYSADLERAKYLQMELLSYRKPSGVSMTGTFANGFLATCSLLSH
jgi:hypothetical protein